MNDMTRPDSPALPTITVTPSFSLVPRNLDDAMKFAKLLSQSELVPKDYQGKEANCFVAMQWGLELGLPPLQAVQNIAVINGRPRLWGDAMIALVRSNPLCLWIRETLSDTEATCTTLRRGDPEPVSRTFTMEDAKKAQLNDKDTYKKYGRRMLQMRARDWCLRDVYPDVLRGMSLAEIAHDEPTDVTSQGSHSFAPPSSPTPTLPAYDQADFDKNLPKWTELITKAKKTADQIIATIESKHTLTSQQRAAITKLAAPAAESDRPATPDELANLKKVAADAAIRDTDIAKHLGIDALDKITAAQLANALAFVNDPVGA